MDENKLRAAGIDYDAALARFVGKRSIYEKYLVKFLEDVHVRDARTAFEQKNYEEMLEQTHALKGLAGTMGMLPLQEVCADIVRDLRSGTLDALEEKMMRLERVQEELREAIRTA